MWHLISDLNITDADERKSNVTAAVRNIFARRESDCLFRTCASRCNTAAGRSL